MTAEHSPALDRPPESRLLPALDRLSNWPWWLLVSILLGLLIIYSILTDSTWTTIFRALLEGIPRTLTMAFVGFLAAQTIGLSIGLGRVSSNVLYYNVATFYVEIIRGIPFLVLILFIAFALAGLFVEGVNGLGEALSQRGLELLGAPLAEFSTRQLSFQTRFTAALAIAYGAFSAEIWRAGIESIERGQMEAARSLGMSYLQSMRYIILPQAVRRVLPAMGNDFVAMVKDTSLAQVLGVREMTQIATLYAASTFEYVSSFLILAFNYLVLTISLTRLVRWLERRLAKGRR
ncbi:MAG: amino acid ABC transporter permease [Candidatus Promineifilaceae bacterium]